MSPVLAAPRVVEDRCALTMVRRLAAMLDRDPATLHEGDPLPFGWHVTMFNLPTLQSRLRPDGAGDLAVPLPDLGLPRLMLGGRRLDLHRPIPIGAAVRRESRCGEVREKTGRSGRFAVVPVEHRVHVERATEPALVEVQEYLLREPAGDEPVPAPAVDQRAPVPHAERVLVPDERLLFRYSAITDNPHRIHYDQRWAGDVEGYPALVVNGTLPALFLLELYRETLGREPTRWASRNRAPMYCGHPLRLVLSRAAEGWWLGAIDRHGAAAFEATVD